MAVKYFGTNHDQSHSYQGLVKVRLWHGQGYSLIIPDFILLKEKHKVFFRPQAFNASMICQTDTDIVGHLRFDINGENAISIRFSKNTILERCRDGSDIYNCIISGPPHIERYADGNYKYLDDKVRLRLFHHTNPATVDKIISSGELWCSDWNFQGTEKKLVDINYAYLTNIPRIRTEEDLTKIAMASGGFLVFMRDGFDPPPPHQWPKDFEHLYKDDLIKLVVPRQSTLDRTGTLTFWVNWEDIAPPYIHKHSDGIIVYYVCIKPEIYRIGVIPGTKLRINGDLLDVPDTCQIQSQYVIVGDASTLDGLKAPFIEEETRSIMKLEKATESETILDFWFEHSNMDHFSGTTIKYHETRDVTPKKDS